MYFSFFPCKQLKCTDELNMCKAKEAFSGGLSGSCPLSKYISAVEI